MRSRTARGGFLAFVGAVLLLTSACTGSDAPSRPCRTVCRGKIDGAAYAIKVPAKWNGTLLVYSHGYRNDTGTGPGPAVLTQNDKDGSGTDAVSRRLLAAGYALAGSSYARPGWAVAEALSADTRLHARFVQLVGRPRHVYAWGSSLGGLISELLAERATWVDGAAPMCGVVGGPLLNHDLFLEAALGVRALIDPQLQIGGWTGVTEALANLQAGAQAIVAAAADGTGGGAAKVLYLAARLGLSLRSQHAPGDTATSRVQAAAESLTTLLEGGAAIRYQSVARFHGDPSGRAPAVGGQIGTQTFAGVRALHGDPVAYARVLASAVPPAASPAARAALRETGDPTGRIRVPVLTMHTEADPLAVVANETVLRDRVTAAGRSALLHQVYVVPPNGYDVHAGPSSGIEHCAFSDDQMVGLVASLDRWVRKHETPTPASIAHDLGGGVDPSFRSPAWPDVVPG